MSLQYQYWLFTANSLANVVTALALLGILWVLLRMRRGINKMLAQDAEYNAEAEEQIKREFQAQLEEYKRSGRVHEVPPGPVIGYTEQQLREMPLEEFEAIKRSGHLEDQLRRAARHEQRFDEASESPGGPVRRFSKDDG